MPGPRPKAQTCSAQLYLAFALYAYVPYSAISRAYPKISREALRKYWNNYATKYEIELRQRIWKSFGTQPIEVRLYYIAIEFLVCLDCPREKMTFSLISSVAFGPYLLVKGLLHSGVSDERVKELKTEFRVSLRERGINGVVNDGASVWH
jgi:hypothetical protein